MADQEAREREQSTASPSGVANKAVAAMKETAQGYLDRASVKIDLDRVETTIGENPIKAVAIAAAAGFLIGGGLATRPGFALLALLVRTAARDAAKNLVKVYMRTTPA